MATTDIVTLDLNFQDRPHAIAAYLIKHSSGAVLIESGPGSTVNSLQAGLRRRGLSASDITHVLLTHIHLDHAGAAGWMARNGAEIIVHPRGATHLENPEKLLASARRIYLDKMETLWGEFIPVPRAQIRVAVDSEEIVIGSLRFIAIDSPGHAEHHYAYLFEDVCFSGDVGGVRIAGGPYLRVPMPPPELHFEKWRSTLGRLRRFRFSRIAPTHFGLYGDPDWQLAAAERALDESERWLEQVMAHDPPIEEVRQQFVQWMDAQARDQALGQDITEAYELANPLAMSADGMLRYWKKVRTAM